MMLACGSGALGWEARDLDWGRGDGLGVGYDLALPFGPGTGVADVQLAFGGLWLVFGICVGASSWGLEGLGAWWVCC